MTGRWVDDVMIFHAVLFEIPLIAARSNNRPVGRRENAEIIILRFRTLHGNAPFTVVRFRADNLNVSAEVDEPARHTAFQVNIGDSAGGIAFAIPPKSIFMPSLAKLMDALSLSYRISLASVSGRRLSIVSSEGIV
mgnify:FL=1